MVTKEPRKKPEERGEKSEEGASLKSLDGSGRVNARQKVRGVERGQKPVGGRGQKEGV